MALEAMQTEHEADRAMDSLMKNTVEQACVLTGDVLERVRVILEGLTVKPERMRRNLDLSGGLILSEALMLRLGESVGRQQAHDIVYDVAQAITSEGGSFAERLKAEPMINSRLDASAIDALLDPSAYTGLCATMADQAANEAIRIAATISDATR